MPGSDVKPDNIIVLDPQAGAPPGSEQRCRLLDYGLAGKASNFKRNAYIQSRYYRSPEVLVGLPATHAVDLWSAGAAPAAPRVSRPPFPSPAAGGARSARMAT